jgi:metal-responsive CopG/Arc/MetJ family transcriptional regulator
VRIPAELNAKLDAWIERQPDPKPSRSEAIRRLLESALDG